MQNNEYIKADIPSVVKPDTVVSVVGDMVGDVVVPKYSKQ